MYSVLMSVYCKENPSFFDSAIASMDKQSIKFNDMVIVCDGPLTQELDFVIEKWKLELKDRLTIVRLTKNHGLGKALAIGLPKCKCDLVARMDSDDISASDRCEKLIKFMESNDLDLVGSAMEEFNNKPGDLRIVRHVPLSYREILKFSKWRCPFNHVTVMFRKHVIENVGNYQPFHYIEDYWLWVRVINAGYKCGNLADILCYARVGSGMYKRRKGIKYAISQCKFFIKLNEIKYISKLEMIASIIIRTMSAIIPECMLKYTYKHALRKNK